MRERCRNQRQPAHATDVARCQETCEDGAHRMPDDGHVRGACDLVDDRLDVGEVRVATVLVVPRLVGSSKPGEVGGDDAVPGSDGATEPLPVPPRPGEPMDGHDPVGTGALQPHRLLAPRSGERQALHAIRPPWLIRSGAAARKEQ